MALAEDILTVIVLLAALGMLIISISDVRQNPSHKYFIIPLLAVSTHMVLFYTVTLIAALLGTTLSHLVGIDEFAHVWSTTLRLHCLSTFLSLIFIYKYKCKETSWTAKH